MLIERNETTSALSFVIINWLPSLSSLIHCPDPPLLSNEAALLTVLYEISNLSNLYSHHICQVTMSYSRRKSDSIFISHSKAKLKSGPGMQSSSKDECSRPPMGTSTPSHPEPTQ